MKETLEIIVAVRRPRFKTKTYETTLEFEYNDKTFVRCENQVRDTLVDIGNRLIDEIYYND